MSGIVIVNLGTGNLRSVSKAVEYVHGNVARVTSDPSIIRDADYLILPGQGAIGTWIDQLTLDPDLQRAVTTRLNDGPVLGICLGLQALFEHSDESGGIDGLGIFHGNVKHFANNHRYTSQSVEKSRRKLKIPHMGWNQVYQVGEHPLWQGIADGERFYFVHSYYVEIANQSDEMGQCTYGNPFTAAAAHDNIFATQFHPEKSQRAGLQLLKNFINWNGNK
ncbi:MAG: imidazole glycerol phosphate synthase subunit HisH [bacterium]